MVALYVFVGNSGVVSFGHISFVAVGAWAAGVLSVPSEEKPATMPNLAGFLRDTTVGNVPSLAIAAAAGGMFALLAGLALMRLSGLAAGIATFAVLEITNNVLRYTDKVGPGLNVVLLGPRDDRPVAGDGRRARSWSSPRSSTSEAGSGGSCGRPATIPPRPARSGSPSTGSGSWRSPSRGCWQGSPAGSTCTCLPTGADSLYLDLTFITLAMLVIGGMTSLWGAVVGALAVSGLDSLLAEAENGLGVAGRTIDLPAGTRIVVVGFLMGLVLVLRPSGLTGGREFSLGRLRPQRPAVARGESP